MNIIIIFFIAISLSMDAFSLSLSLAYGTILFSKKKIMTLSLIVGLYHFFMPIMGIFIGTNTLKLIPIESNIIVTTIFIFVGLDMIIESFKEKENIKKLNLFEMLLFGLIVSIDSFAIGVGLDIKNITICSLVFSITSFTFTYLGLFIGNKIKLMLGSISSILGGFTLIILGILHII